MNAVKHVLTHWMTSGSGLTLGILTLVLNGRSKQDFALALAQVIIGFISKDPNKH